MKLTAEEVAEFEDEGYLFFPNKFSSAEAKVLKNAASDVYAMDREEVWRESSGAARTAFAAHTYRSTYTSIRSTLKPPSTVTSGNGIRTMARGNATMTCRNPGP